MTQNLFPLESKQSSIDLNDATPPPEKGKPSVFELCDDILHVVHGQPVFISDGDRVVKTAHAQIQLCVKRMVQVLKEQEAELPSLQHLKKTKQIGFVRELLTLFMSERQAKPVKERAVYTLQCLERVNPHFEALNCQLHRLQKKSAERAQLCLGDYTDALCKPLKLQVPVAPYVLPAKLPAYLRAYQGKPEQIVIKNPEAHLRFWKVNEIYINTLKPDYACFERNLREIGEREKFQVMELPFECSHQWIRDPLVLKCNGELLLPADLNNDGTSFRRIVKRITGEEYGAIQGQVAKLGLTKEILKSGMPGMQVARFYFEGGNLVETFDPVDGELCYLSGASNLLFSLLNAEVTFHGLENDLLQFMAAREKDKLFDQDAIQRMQKKLERALLLTDFTSAKEQEWIAKLSLHGIEYIKTLMMKTLQASVVFLGDPLESQPAFHNDLYLTPTPEFVMVHCPAACSQLIQDVYERRDLTQADKARLKMYYEQNEMTKSKQVKKYAQITNDLKDAGFKVVRVPGLFYDDEGDVAVNFFNSVVGTVENTQGGAKKYETFCITNGSAHPVDKYLREAFVLRMREMGISRTYFTGRDEEQGVNVRALKYEGARKSLEKSGAVHCRVQTTNALFKPVPKNAPKKDPGFVPARDTVSVSLPRFFKTMLDLAAQQK